MNRSKKKDKKWYQADLYDDDANEENQVGMSEDVRVIYSEENNPQRWMTVVSRCLLFYE